MLPLPAHCVWRFFKAFEIGWQWNTRATRFDLWGSNDQIARCRTHYFLSASFFFLFFFQMTTTAYRTDGSQLLWQIPSGRGQSAWRALWLGHGLLRPAASLLQLQLKLMAKVGGNEAASPLVPMTEVPWVTTCCYLVTTTTTTSCFIMASHTVYTWEGIVAY